MEPALALEGPGPARGDDRGVIGSTRRWTFLLTLVFGVATVGLGSWGYLEAGPGDGIWDALYAGIQLLALEYNGPAGPPPSLEVARYLGGATLALAIISVLVAFARERAGRFLIRVFARRHHVVAGAGARGLAVASRLRAEGKRVVVIGDPAGEGVAVARARDLPVVAGDPRDPRSYRHAAAGRAEHVFISPGDDSANLRALEAFLEAFPDLGPTVHVAIDGPLLWRELHRAALTWEGPGGAIEFVSLPDRVAARLVAEARADLPSGRITVWGAGPAAVRTAVHAVRWLLLEGGRPTLVLAGPGAEALDGDLRRIEPWIGAAARVEVAVEPVDPEPGAAFVVGLPHDEVLAGASVLAGGLERAAIVVEVPRPESVTALHRSGYPLGRVRLLDAESQVLGGTLFERSGRELIARARHAYYVEQDLARGATSETNPSLRPWEELPDSLRESNRLFADSIGERLADLGARLEPLVGPVGPPDIAPDLVEELAELEHERWRNDLEAGGWHHHDGPKDPERKLHPLLVDWKDLDDAEREKDRDAIRALPHLLARVGYGLRIDEESSQSQFRGAGQGWSA